MVVNAAFWRGKRVLVTGHTGFKGGWLSLWLQRLGAAVSGYSLPAPTQPSLFAAAQVEKGMVSVLGDIRDLPALINVFETHRPEVIIHLAAQALVQASYQDPVETFGTNVMGTVNVLEATRQTPGVHAVVIVTSDKCYENREWIWGYREYEAMGGRDPYSASKGAAELVSGAYRSSFFSSSGTAGVATARAGNVIGGGDWGVDRLIPDMVRAYSSGRPALIRNSRAIRPWQYVLEPLAGYLMLAERLSTQPAEFAESWNFGPPEPDTVDVAEVADRVTSLWGQDARWEQDRTTHSHEAHTLRLDSSKSRARLKWRPRLSLDTALERTVAWYRAALRGEDMRTLSEGQIEHYQAGGGA
ncbi:MAG: CDP-glucose 4,6-dehydratase [Burkholderiales bacterium]|nr:CDP-glucose 4,6-dehydratase [Burkholderiales bacterium]